MSCFNLPRWLLTRFAAFKQIQGQEGPVQQTVDEMVDQLAEKECGVFFRMAKEGFHGCENIMRADCPEVEFVSDFG